MPFLGGTGIVACAPSCSTDLIAIWYGRLSANAIDKWFLPCHNAIMTGKLTLDKAGRVVLPKPVRDRLQLAPGDTLQLEAQDESITLRPVRQKVTLKKEFGIWVYQGESTDTPIVDLVDRERESRIRQVAEQTRE